MQVNGRKPVQYFYIIVELIKNTVTKRMSIKNNQFNICTLFGTSPIPTMSGSKASFEEVKRLVAANPMIFIPDLNKPFIVTTDASNYATGAVLSQVVDGEKRVIEFASKYFSTTQQKYSTKKEATVIIFALRKWRHFLLGQEITVETDHRPLQWLLTKKDCSDKLGRYR